MKTIFIYKSNCGSVQHFSLSVRVLGGHVRVCSQVDSVSEACERATVCVFGAVWMWQRYRRSRWRLKVVLVRQTGPFNQVPHIRQLCPHSKQLLCPAGETQHPAQGRKAS